MRFEFATGGKIVFGAGALADVGAITKQFGRRPLVVTGRNLGRADPLIERLKAAGMDTAPFSIPGEPLLDDITRGVAAARASGCDVIIGFGGGSALDAAKAIAALLTNSGELLDYLE